ncbi:MAG TPA: heavy metal-binding domain-containing protein, partial [Candidatus Binataceae bacterium]
MSVEPAASAGSFQYLEKTYYFCNTHCLEKFKADPSGFVSRKRSTPDGTTREYTCPMHPEVRQMGPGACPKCAMALEPVSPAPAKTEYVCPMHPQIVRSEPGSCPICGMALEPRTVSETPEENRGLIDMTRRFWVSLALTIPVVLAGMSDLLFTGSLLSPVAMNWAEMILATPVVMWGGAPFFQRGWQSLVNRSFNMFTLIALGVGVAYIYSLV